MSLVETEIPVEINDHEQNLSERIANWARYTAERGWRSSTCMSIEGRYRRTSRPDDTKDGWGDWLITPVEAPWRPDIADAWRVEDAWKELPVLFRFCLQFVYLKRWKPRKVWMKLAPYRSLRLRVKDFDEVLMRARSALRNQLQRGRK
jgi:hypothetical protein